MLQAFLSHGLFQNFVKISNYAYTSATVAPNMIYSRIRFVRSEVLLENQQHLNISSYTIADVEVLRSFGMLIKTLW